MRNLIASLVEHDIRPVLVDGAVSLDRPEGRLAPEALILISQLRGRKGEVLQFLAGGLLPEESVSITGIEAPIRVREVRSVAGLDAMEEVIFQDPPRRIFVDLETAPLEPGLKPKDRKLQALDPFRGGIVSVQVLAGDTCYVVRPDMIFSSLGDGRQNPMLFGGLERILIDPKIVKVFHNGGFDLSFMIKHLFYSRDLGITNLFDTYLAEALLTAGLQQGGKDAADGGLSLAAVSRRHAGVTLDKGEQATFELGAELTPDQVRYAVGDVACLPRMVDKQVELLDKEGLFRVAELEFALLPIVARLQLTGMLVNQDQLDRLLPEYERKVAEQQALLRDMVGDQDFNPGSWQQVKAYLHDILRIPVKDTSEKTLQKHQDGVPFVRELLRYRTQAKRLGTYIRPLQSLVREDGRIHPSFKQLGACTGRFSTANPSVQNFPKEDEFRALIKAPSGYKLISSDYASIEARILAEMSQDPGLLEACRDTKNKFFRALASKLFDIPLEEVTKEQYSRAKTIGYGLSYGMESEGLAERSGITVKEARDQLNHFFRMFPEAKRTLTELAFMPAKVGYAETLMGRRRYFSPADTYGQKKAIEREAKNSPIQGTSADVIKVALRRVNDRLNGYDARLINCVHDELVLEVKTEEVEQVKALVEKCMITAGQEILKSVPVLVETLISDEWRKG